MSASSTFPPSSFGSAMRPPQREKLGRGFAFALAAHALLVLGLSAGLAWRTQNAPAFEAELWASVPVAAAPREQEPPPPPPEESKPEPAKPTPPPPDTQAEQQQREAEIAIAKERKRKLEKQREEEELERKRLAEQEAKRREELKKKEEALKQAKLKEEQAKKDKAEKEKAEKEKTAKADAAAKKAEAQAEARREALRQENLKRIQGMAGASGGPQATGSALQSAGPSASYAGRIKARVRPNIIYTDSGPGNPLAEVEVSVRPDGTIFSRRLVKPSGNAEWDAAVLRAIDKTETLPRDVDGRVPPLMVLAFQPRE